MKDSTYNDILHINQAADEKAAHIDQLYYQLYHSGGDGTPVHLKALQIINEQRIVAGREPFDYDIKPLMPKMEALAAIEDQGLDAQVSKILDELMMLLPANPLEAIVVRKHVFLGIAMLKELRTKDFH